MFQKAHFRLHKALLLGILAKKLVGRHRLNQFIRSGGMSRKLILSVVFIFAMFLHGAENLLKNPSFEEGLAFWTNSNSSQKLIAPQIDEAVSADGQKSLRIVGEPDKVANFQQSVALPEGTTELTYAGRIKTSGIPRGWCASMHLNCHDAKNKKLKTFIKKIFCFFIIEVCVVREESDCFV